MVKVSVSTVIEASVEKVWSIARDFSNVAWLDGATTGVSPIDGPAPDRVGVIRNLPLGDGLKVLEQLTSLDDRAHVFSYVMTETTLPLSNYYAKFSVFPITETGGSFTLWDAEWDAEDAVLTQGIIRDGVFKPSLLKLKAAAESL